MRQAQNFTIGLIGNPNCGKTTLFNALTGSKQRVGNWPGVTVERKSGFFTYEGRSFEIVDLPGTYSLDMSEREVSLDEMVARNFLQEGQADLIVNIVDASSLERNLYLTTQLADMGVPLLLVLNMMDVAESKGMTLDAKQLEHQLGCPAIPVVASEGRGVELLKRTIAEAVDQPALPKLIAKYEDALESAILQIQEALCQNGSKTNATRWHALRLLEGDTKALAGVHPEISRLTQKLAGEIGEDFDLIVADGRYGLANQISNATVKFSGKVARDTTDCIDRIVLNRVLGIPIFLLVMYLMFMLTINLGGAFIDFFDMAAKAIFVDGVGQVLDAAGCQLADCDACHWYRRGNPDSRYIYPDHRIFISVSGDDRGLRLHGTCGFCDGSLHASDRFARKIICTTHRRFWVQRASHHGYPNP